MLIRNLQLIKQQLYMLENLFNLVKEFSGDQVINNPAVPNERNNDVMAEATHSIAGGLQNIAAGGGLQSILQLFSGGGNRNSLLSNPIVSMMAGHFMNKLMNKHGLNSQQASGIASSLIPNVLSSLIQRTNDQNNNSFDLNGILQSLTGNATAQKAGGLDIRGLINQFTGNGGNVGGGMQDILNQFTNQTQQNMQRQPGSGGLMDLIKTFAR
jgi:hypothetical protein